MYSESQNQKCPRCKHGFFPIEQTDMNKPCLNKDFETNFNILVNVVKETVVKENKLTNEIFSSWWGYMYEQFVALGHLNMGVNAVRLYINSLKDYDDPETIGDFSKYMYKVLSFLNRYHMRHLNLKSLKEISEYVIENRDHTIAKILLENQSV